MQLYNYANMCICTYMHIYVFILLSADEFASINVCNYASIKVCNHPSIQTGKYATMQDLK